MDASDLYSKFWKKIVFNGKAEQVTKGLKVCRTDSETIAYVRQLLDDSGLLQQIQFIVDEKNETKAIECRKRGNENFHPRIKKYIAAIECYNESIALSNGGSKNLAIAYANRSAVCFELKEYNACLENIRLVLQNPYPERLIPKLLQRKQCCLEMINNNHRPAHFDMILCEPKLCSKPNPKIPFISDCLELEKNDRFGRHLVTNKKLNPGDFVVIEKPFSKMLLPNLRYMNCDYCLEDKFLILIPCHHCSITMFCSEMCQQKAYQSYHRIECPIIKHLHKLFPLKVLVPLRTTIMAISSFDYDLQDLLEHVETLGESSLNSFDLDWTKLQAKQVYSTIHMLATNQNLRTPNEMIQLTVLCIATSEVLLNYTPLRSFCGNIESHRDLIRIILFRHLQISSVNSCSINRVNYYPHGTERFKENYIGGGLFPILSMLNNSCAPNITRIPLPNGRIAAIVLRPIDKDGQLFCCYGYHHLHNTLFDRHPALYLKYHFKCRCEACQYDYPLRENLKHIALPSYFDIDSREWIVNYRNRNIAEALKNFRKHCKFLKDYDCKYPNYEVCVSHGDFIQCLNMIYSPHSQYIKYQGLCYF
ncbi:SET and MYND domain-containing protein 4-like [Malaya genurostris]|uniref:SET and MYND domain-containing protein 4-like n=1 Tax=Malaya genurostris TaxID=325434 RepID=UPI0026F39727|nr:SET and MYND domain-containing protein 4-like [Malaya genurostris]